MASLGYQYKIIQAYHVAVPFMYRHLAWSNPSLLYPEEHWNILHPLYTCTGIYMYIYTYILYTHCTHVQGNIYIVNTLYTCTGIYIYCIQISLYTCNGYIYIYMYSDIYLQEYIYMYRDIYLYMFRDIYIYM